MVDSDLDLSPPRPRHDSDGDLSPPRQKRKHAATSLPSDPKSKAAVPDKTGGLVTGKDIKEELSRKKHEELERLKLLNASAVGAETVYRDKLKGIRISKDEYILQEKPKKEEKKLEWGRGLAQKREAEAKLLHMAWFRDDEDLDRSLKDAIRWGDPMAHLVTRKQPGVVLADLGDDEKMRESGFIIPQEIPIHSWMKRGLMEAAANRYAIKPGRHWDGVDRSNGCEKELFKRNSNKRATEREAYLWSVSDM